MKYNVFYDLEYLENLTLVKSLTLLLIVVALLGIMIPRLCCCESKVQTVASESNNYSCCHSKVDNYNQAVFSKCDSNSYLKGGCACTKKISMMAVTSTVFDYTVYFQEFVVKDFVLKRITPGSQFAQSLLHLRGPPDYVGLRAGLIYLLHQSFRC